MAEQVKVTLYNDAGCPWGSYQRDRAEARSAAGSPTQLQDKHAKTDGPVRYTAPSLVFERAGMRFEAGGWQTIDPCACRGWGPPRRGGRGSSRHGRRADAQR